MLYNIEYSDKLKSSNTERTILKTKNFDYFDVFIAPATGPRNIISMGINKILLKTNFTKSKWLFGGSTGALRFISFLSSYVSNVDYCSKLVEHLCNMYYKYGDTPDNLDTQMDHLYTLILPKKLINNVLNCKAYKLGIFVCKLKPEFENYTEFQMKIILCFYYLKYLINKDLINELFDRYCFYSGELQPTMINENECIKYCKLTEDNIYQVLHATTSVPFVHKKCEYITGLGEGLYYDAALTDYMINVKIKEQYTGLMLSDYNTNLIYNTVFDLYNPLNINNTFENITIIYPNEEFVNLFPNNEIPNIQDWFKDIYIKIPELRMRKWIYAYKISLEYFPKNLSFYF